MNIRNISCPELFNDFISLVIELKCDNHYNANNDQYFEWIKRRVKLLLDNNGLVLGLYSEQNDPAGMIIVEYDKGLENVRCFGKKAIIKMFGLFEKYRAQKLGGTLLSEIEKQLKKFGCECLYADTYAKNIGAIRYYVKNGFIAAANHPGENGINVDEQIYLYKKL